MADRGPQRAGAYERPARTKGWIIGIVVSLPSSSWPSHFFRTAAGAAAFGAGGAYAISERSSGARQGWLVRDSAAARPSTVVTLRTCGATREWGATSCLRRPSSPSRMAVSLCPCV